MGKGTYHVLLHSRSCLKKFSRFDPSQGELAASIWAVAGNQATVSRGAYDNCKHCSLGEGTVPKQNKEMQQAHVGGEPSQYDRSGGLNGWHP